MSGRRPNGGPATKPWYLRWWAIALYVLLGLAVLGSLNDDDEASDTQASPASVPATASPSLSPDSQPTSTPTDTQSASVVTVPDVLDATGEAATDVLEQTGLEARLVDGIEDRSVMVPSNWVVLEQSPGPGEVVPDNTTVELRMRKDSDPLPRQPWAQAPTDGTWPGGQVPYGASHDFASYRFTVAGPPAATTEEGGSMVEVQTDFDVTRHAETSEYDPPIGEGYTFLFLPGNEPAKAYAEDYGAADFACAQRRLDPGESTTCRLTFTPDSPEEIPNFFWSVEAVTFGAWPSQDSHTAEGHEWAEVARMNGVSKAHRTEPFQLDGQVRASYTFDFEPPRSYIYGDLTLLSADSGDCGARASTRRGLTEPQGVESFGYFAGNYCANFHPPDAAWDAGNLTIIIEELR